MSCFLPVRNFGLFPPSPSLLSPALFALDTVLLSPRVRASSTDVYTGGNMCSIGCAKLGSSVKFVSCYPFHIYVVTNYR